MIATTDGFTIDAEFAELCPPPTAEERNNLMLLIEKEGCRDSLIVWKEQDILVDGHTRKGICDELGVDYSVTRMSFDSREAVIDWIVINQLGRRNLPEEKKDYLRGLRYRTEKKKHGGDRKSSDQNEHLIEQKERTAVRIAKELGVSEATVRRDAEYSEAVDAIGKNVGREAKAEILSGNSGLTKGRVVEIAQQPAEKQAESLESAKRGAPPEKKQERVVDDPCGEIIGELHKLTKSPSLVAPYSEIKRLVAELREAYRKQHGRS